MLPLKQLRGFIVAAEPFPAVVVAQMIDATGDENALLSTTA
jgi:hypothetical protein